MKLRGLSNEKAAKLILSVGTHHHKRPLSPIEVAEYISDALDENTSREELARFLHLENDSMIGKFLRLLSLPKEVQLVIDWGSEPSSISFSSASEIARLKRSTDQETLAKSILEFSFSKSEVQQIIQIKKRSGLSIDESITAVVNQRPKLEKKHIIIGQILSENLVSKLQTLSQHERNMIFEKVISEHFPEAEIQGAKLSKDKFLLVGDETLNNSLNALPDGFEVEITSLLSNEI